MQSTGAQISESKKSLKWNETRHSIEGAESEWHSSSVWHGQDEAQANRIVWMRCSPHVSHTQKCALLLFYIRLMSMRIFGVHASLVLRSNAHNHQHTRRLSLGMRDAHIQFNSSVSPLHIPQWWTWNFFQDRLHNNVEFWVQTSSGSGSCFQWKMAAQHKRTHTPLGTRPTWMAVKQQFEHRR